MGVGDVISARLVAARQAVQLPEPIRFARSSDMRPADQSPGVGGGFAWAQRFGKDRWVRDDPNVSPLTR
jgi:hypothetical protein